MGRSHRRKEELESRYGNGAFAPISIDYINKARELSAKYIVFANKNNKHGVCERCGKDVEFSHTRHKQMIKCPNCGTELEVRHTWRGKCVWNVEWFVVGEAVDDTTFALRYIRVSQANNYVRNINEDAREIYDFKHGWQYKFSNIEEGWTVDSNYFFTEFTMNYHRRNNCCIGAISINNVVSELSKLSALKYFDKLNEYFSVYVYARDNVMKLMDVCLYEKLEKVGLGKLGMERYENYWRPFKYKRNETELVKMLGINKQHLKILKLNGNTNTLNFIRKYVSMPLNTLEYLVKEKCMETYDWACQCGYEKPLKLVNYLTKNEIGRYEYGSHMNMLGKLGYEIDDNYRYPKDFKKEHARIIDEYNAMLDEEKIGKMGEQSKLIKKISDGLRKMPDLKEFLGGSNGLLVYVPESARDLVTEGRKLHNCISSYVDRIADGKTLVFFVRRLNAPNDPFVAFEYCNGEVIQCRYDHNEAVKDDKIINFVDRFAQKLRENNVLMAAA